MVDSFIGIEPNFIEGFRDELFFAPVDIPVILFGLFVLSGKHGFLNAVHKKCLEFNLRTMVRYWVTRGGENAIF